MNRVVMKIPFLPESAINLRSQQLFVGSQQLTSNSQQFPIIRDKFLTRIANPEEIAAEIRGKLVKSNRRTGRKPKFGQKKRQFGWKAKFGQKKRQFGRKTEIGWKER